MKLLLYSTPHCHLCEQAEAILRSAGVDAEPVDISRDGALLERYGVRIPVLVRTGDGAELGWPFDGEMLAAFLE